MGMLLYMADLERQKQKQTQAQGAAKKAAPKPVVETEKKPEKKQEDAKKPSRVEIMRMNVATVREYATKQGIEGANAMSGAELKRILVNKMFEEE